jgi:hypothetical protein
VPAPANGSRAPNVPSSRSSGKKIDDDGNASGQIDAGDYDVWRAHFGQTAGVGAASRAAQSPPRLGGPTAAVPEPSAAILLVLSLPLWLRRRKREQKRGQT